MASFLPIIRQLYQSPCQQAHHHHRRVHYYHVHRWRASRRSTNQMPIRQGLHHHHDRIRGLVFHLPANQMPIRQYLHHHHQIRDLFFHRSASPVPNHLQFLPGRQHEWMSVHQAEEKGYYGPAE